MDELKAKVEMILKNVIGDENNNWVSDWDSLSKISILASVQNEFGISISLSEMKNINNVDDLVKIIEEKRV